MARAAVPAVAAPLILIALLGAAATSLLLPAPAAAGAWASVTLAEPVYQGPLTAVARAARAAPMPGSGGWYWPIATEDFLGRLDRRCSYVHVAQDMSSAVGRPRRLHHHHPRHRCPLNLRRAINPGR